MTKQTIGEKIQYIISAPFLNEPFNKIEGKDRRPVMDWQYTEIRSLIELVVDSAIDECQKVVEEKKNAIDGDGNTQWELGYYQGCIDVSFSLKSLKESK